MYKDRERNIIGIETEYGLAASLPGEAKRQPLADDQIRFIIARCLPSDVQRVDDTYGMLNTGDRFYSDVEHPEFSTREVTSLAALVKAEKDGERIAYQTFANAVAAGHIGSFALNKRVVAPRVGETWGAHENYGFDPHLFNPWSESGFHITDAVRWMAGFLAVRSILFGGGAVYQPVGARQMSYQVSQKALTLECDVTQYTTTKKGVFNTRNNPWADGERYRRLHVVFGDPHILLWPMIMQPGLTELVVRTMEHGLVDTNYLLPPGGIYKVAQAVSSDITCQEVICLANGKTIKPYDLMGKYIEQFDSLKSRIAWSREYDLVIAECTDALGKLAVDPRSLSKKLDWVMRLARIKFEMSKQFGLGSEQWRYEDERVQALDFSYDAMGPNSFAAQVRNSGKAWTPPEWFNHQEDPDYGIAPRTLFRRELVEALAGKERVVVGWDRTRVITGTEGQSSYWFHDDPFGSGSPELKAEIAAVAAGNPPKRYSPDAKMPERPKRPKARR